MCGEHNHLQQLLHKGRRQAARQDGSRESQTLLRLGQEPCSRLSWNQLSRESHPLLQLLPVPGGRLKWSPGSRESHPLLRLLPVPRGRLKWSPGSRESHPLLQSLLEPWSLLRPQHCPRESSLSNPRHPQLLTHPFHLLPHHNLPSSPRLSCMSVGHFIFFGFLAFFGYCSNSRINLFIF